MTFLGFPFNVIEVAWNLLYAGLPGWLSPCKRNVRSGLFDFTAYMPQVSGCNFLGIIRMVTSTGVSNSFVFHDNLSFATSTISPFISLTRFSAQHASGPNYAPYKYLVLCQTYPVLSLSINFGNCPILMTDASRLVTPVNLAWLVTKLLFLRLYLLFFFFYFFHFVFACRADIKQYIGPPSPKAIYKIYHSCIKELVRVGFLNVLYFSEYFYTRKCILSKSTFMSVHMNRWTFEPNLYMISHSGPLSATINMEQTLQFNMTDNLKHPTSLFFQTIAYMFQTWNSNLWTQRS